MNAETSVDDDEPLALRPDDQPPISLMPIYPGWRFKLGPSLRHRGEMNFYPFGELGTWSLRARMARLLVPQS